MKREFDTTIKIYTLALLVEDVPGMLSQVARLFSRKGYNIESIVSGETDRPGMTRISIAVKANELDVDRVAAQCRKLNGVRNVKILDEDQSIMREIAIIKVAVADRNSRDEILQLINIFKARVIDVDLDTMTIWVFGRKTKNDSLILLLKEFGILEIAKTGTIAIERGRSTIYDDDKLRDEYDYGKGLIG